MALITRRSPSLTLLARCEVLKQHVVGERESEVGADFSSLVLPRLRWGVRRLIFQPPPANSSRLPDNPPPPPPILETTPTLDGTPQFYGQAETQGG